MSLYLHPTHGLFQQLAHPACPVCGLEITYMTPVSLEYLPDGRYMVVHEACGDEEEDETDEAG